MIVSELVSQSSDRLEYGFWGCFCRFVGENKSSVWALRRLVLSERELVLIGVSPRWVVFSLSESLWRFKRIRLGKTSRICLLDANSLGEAGFPVDGPDSVVGSIDTSRTFFHRLASSLVDWAIGFEMCLPWKER